MSSLKPITSNSSSTLQGSEMAPSSSSSVSLSLSSLFTTQNFQSSLWSYDADGGIETDSDSDEDIPFPEISDLSIDTKGKGKGSAEGEHTKMLMQMSASSAMPVNWKLISLEPVLNSLKISKGDWANHIYGAKLFYELGELTEDEIEPSILKVQGKCLEKNGRVPHLLDALTIQLGSIPKIDREKLFRSFLENSKLEKKTED